MGLIRFFLAASVVMGHVGGGTYISARAAVLCFYLISGYLVTRVYESHYRGLASTPLRFYANRAMRILPLYWVAIAASIVIGIIGAAAWETNPALQDTLFQEVRQTALSLTPALLLNEMFFDLGVTIWPVAVSGDPELVPQGWSLAVEMFFYLIAPPLLLLRGRAPWLPAALAIASLALGTYTTIWGDGFTRAYYNAITTFYSFWLGMALFHVTRNRQPLPANRAWPTFAIGTTGLMVVLHSISADNGAPIHFGVLAALAFAVLALWGYISLQPNLPMPLRRADQVIGDTSYGIYLFHFVVAVCLIHLTDKIDHDWHIPTPFSLPSHTVFGLATIATTTALAVGVYFLIEGPIERIRRRIRGRRPPEQGDSRDRLILAAGCSAVLVAMIGASALTFPKNIAEALVDEDEEAIAYFLSHDPDLNAKYMYGGKRQTPLVHTVQADSQKYVERLISLGVDLKNPDNSQALCAAILMDDDRMASTLVEAGVPANASCGNHSVIRLAAGRGRTEVVQKLAAASASLGGLDSAICGAAEGGHGSTIDVLLQFGANPAHPCEDGRLPATVARQSGNSGIAKRLAAAAGSGPN